MSWPVKVSVAQGSPSSPAAFQDLLPFPLTWDPTPRSTSPLLPAAFRAFAVLRHHVELLVANEGGRDAQP